ncbi:putative ABC transport system permease protein [Archangium gephyra]|uniref:ABC transport system permease protein n=1 Tax=Archangium gephyra TaxID=48 RepID=A0AAC8Q4L2_9BACT|nr:FtsX-like permease family protein [Archangium gephyra]AKJ00787.1 ABC transporter, permease protein [Archangium gephyra]REG25950.1 putative ABC transport system permease protein [Archangium gephyra]
MSTLSSIAARNVARNRRRSLVTLAAVLLGVTAVLVLRGFIDGFVRLMVDDIVQGKTGALQIHTAGYMDSSDALPLEPSLPYDETLLARVRAVPGVTGVTGRIQFSGLVSNGVSQTMFVGRALDLVTEKQAVPRAGFDVMPGGRALAGNDHAHAILGNELAQSFHAVTPAEKAKAAGAEALVDRVTLASSSPKGRANSLDVSVEGLSVSSLPFENKRVVTVPLKLAQELLGLEGRVTELAVAVDDLRNLERIAADLREQLGPRYEVHTWQELQPFVRDIISRQRFVMGLISVILFIIILTGIINTMLMSVFERVREIGTMLAVGMRRKQVLTMFLVEATLLGVLGGVGGVLLGSAIVRGIAARGIPMSMVVNSGSQSVLRPELDPSFVGLTLAVAVVGALAAAAWPAWRASRLDPVEALRSV